MLDILLFWFLTILLFMIAAIVVWQIMEYVKKRKFNYLKAKLTNKHKYQCFYITENDLKEDPAATELSSISYPGYVDSTYGRFYKNLTVEHLPINVLVNWTRTIAEDLIASVSPVNHVASWNDYFHSEEYKAYANSSVHPDIVEFEEHELAYIWGAVYYWLKCIIPNYNNEEVLNYIEKVAIKKEFLRPYFYHYKRLATGSESLPDDKYGPSPLTSKGELTAEQTALLWLAIAMLTEDNVTKKSLAPAISRVSGVGEQSIRCKIVGSFKETDKAAVASIFKETMPNLAEKIMKM
jgi:hypothetical protein